MLRHHWHTAIRNLKRYKLFTFINIFGLSLGIAIFLSLMAYVDHHFSFDKFYERGDKIYRVNYFEYQGGQPVLQSSRTHSRAALLIHEYAPQVEAVTRIYHEKAYIFNEDVRQVDQDMLFADSSFFKVFPVNIISGSAETGLVAPNSVMISQSQARAYFGDADPIGKTIFFNERLPVTVTGIFEDIPKTASVDYKFLLSWSTIYFYGWGPREGDFDGVGSITFVRLKDKVTDVKSVNDGLTKMANEHITTLKNRGHTARYELQPYQDLHTSNALAGELKPGISKTLLYALISLAIFILVAAWINYINLSLARSIERAEEIGVRKVFGASQGVISSQFMLEASILAIITFLIGYLLYYLFTGLWANVFFTNLDFQSPNIFTFIKYFAGFILVTALVAFYPAQFMSRFKPALIMKNKLAGRRGRAGLLHQGLMIFQLFMAVCIVGITLVAGKQLKFIHDFDSGFNTSHTIALRAPASTNSDSLRLSRYRAFRNDVLQLSAFKTGCASMNIPGQEIRYHNEAIHAVGSDNLKKQMFWEMWVDEGYTETFGIPILNGRNFAAEEKSNACLINETAAQVLGFKNPSDAAGTRLIAYDKQFVIVGVLKDYHHESVRKSVDPIVFYYKHPHEYGYYSFRAESRDGKYLSDVEKIWKKHYPNDIFAYHFMNDFFEGQYQSDALFSKLLKIFSIVSILVASLGLFGMASLAMVKRTKEIAVRKVLGATVMNILLMISKGYTRLILISCCFAFPLAWYLTNQWLTEFNYKIDVSWWMIVVPGIIVLATTLLTIAGLSIKAAVANPATSLKEQ
jgi:putative ABC transport system permease protein